MSAIYWFSGTGNSLYAAKFLAGALGDMPLVPVAAGAAPGEVGGAGEKIGFVFPSYYGNLPRSVRAFVDQLVIKQGTYLFAVVTMGAFGQGAIAALETALAAKGLRLHYGRGIRMPANYIMMYNPASTEKSAGKLTTVNRKLSARAREIAAGAQRIKKINFTAQTLYKNIEALDRAFCADAACTSCGLCARLCPVGNIRLQGGKPNWQGRCEHCAACISWCPAKAIQYGNQTQKRRRYHNPAIQAEELARAKAAQ
ncbi:MAG: EFR1 family ferrodoxin [Oscillospiraceae bacterium]|jgi:ferredoxin|nr:EFR1 family ferrodoxin [Oscillospiraceae bacterium]